MHHPQRSHSTFGRMAGILAVSALAMGISACGQRDDATLGQRNQGSPVERSQPSVADTRTNTDSTMAGGVSNGSTGPAPGAAAGTNTDSSMAGAARDTAQTAMDKVDDATITAQVSAGLARDPDLSATRIDVDTRDGVVTLKGPATNPAAKQRAETIARNVKGVTSVSNELQVSG